jgi:HD-GYP domain-containing protein (c-di-GMP phosphodiesterase class II)
VYNHKKEKNQNKEKNSPFLSSKALSKRVEEIFLRFSSALKTAQIYELNNMTFMEQIRSLFSLINEIFTEEGQALFQFQENTLFLNNNRIKFDLVSFHHFKFLSGEFRRKEIGTIKFELGLDDEELAEFVGLLAHTREKKDTPFEDFHAELEFKGIDHISVEKIHPYDPTVRLKTEDIKQVAKKVYFKSMAHLKESFDRHKENKKLSWKISRRLIQSIVDLISQDESFMIGMTNIKNHDEYTVNHSTNVAVLAVCFGSRLGLEKEEMIELGLAALYHDVGKLDIPKEILDKRDKLSENEKEIMEKHTFHGVEKLIGLRDSNYLPVKTLYVALEHHLWTNFSGYPKFWKRNKIGLYSKIVKICDFFDSITTERPYRDHVLTRDQALSLMMEKSGTEFDPALLKLFASMVGVYPIGSLVSLDTQELGIVMEANFEMTFMLRPKVKIIANRKGEKIDGEIIDLTELDQEKGNYKRTIVKSLNPNKYSIRVSDYFLTL